MTIGNIIENLHEIYHADFDGSWMQLQYIIGEQDFSIKIDGGDSEATIAIKDIECNHLI